MSVRRLTKELQMDRDMAFAKMIQDLQKMTDDEIRTNMATVGYLLAELVSKGEEKETIKNAADIVLVCGDILKARKEASRG